MENTAHATLSAIQDQKLSISAKVGNVLGLKSEIKQKNVPETAVPSIFETLRLCITSAHPSLALAGFSTFGHFMKRLTIQGMTWPFFVFIEAFASAVAARLNDSNDRVRGASSETLFKLHQSSDPASVTAVENCLTLALTGDANARVAALNQIFWTSQTVDLVLDQFVPAIIENLKFNESDPEHPDNTHLVRDHACESLIRLFQYQSPHIKRLLKTKMEKAGVDESIATRLLVDIGLDSETFLFRAHSGGAAPAVPKRADRTPSWAFEAPPKTESPADVAASVAQENATAGTKTSLHNTESVSVTPTVDKNAEEITISKRPQPSRPTAEKPAEKTNLSKAPQPPRKAADKPAEETTLSKGPQPPRQTADKPADKPALSKGPQPPRQAADKPAEDITLSKGPQPRPTGARSADEDHESSQAPRPTVEKATVETNVAKPRPKSALAAPAVTQDTSSPEIEPRNFTSARELEQVVGELLPPFVGKETDTNWQRRERCVVVLHRITLGNAPHTYKRTYLNLLKSTQWLDNIHKVASSPRTTMQTTGLAMLQSFARVNGAQLDSVLDILMQNAMHLCGNTKKITSINGRDTVNAFLENLTCNSRVVFHIIGAAASNNTSLRLYSAGWIQILIGGQSRHKTTVDLLDKILVSIKNGVSDSKEEIRVAYRATFWDFYKVWPVKAKTILKDMAPKHKQMIERDPANPNNDPFVSSSSAPSTGLFSSTPGRPTVSRPTVRGPATTAPTTRGINTATKTPVPSTGTQTPTVPAQPAQSSETEIAGANRPRKKLRPAVTATGTPKSSLASAPMRPHAARSRGTHPEPKARPATAIGVHRRPQMESPDRPSLYDNIANPKIRPSNPAVETSLATTSESMIGDNTSPQKDVAAAAIQASARAGSVTIRMASASWPNVEGSELQSEGQTSKEIATQGTETGDDTKNEGEEHETVLGEMVGVARSASGGAKPDEDAENFCWRPSSRRSAPPTMEPEATEAAVSDEQDDDMSDVEAEDEGKIRERLPSHGSNGCERSPIDEPNAKWTHPPRADLSLRSQDLAQARKMLTTAIEKIENKEMHIAGYRKLQALIEFHKLQLADEKQGGALITALLNDLEPTKPTNKVSEAYQPAHGLTERDRRTQILFTVKYMVSHMEEWFLPHCHSTVIALLKIRQPNDENLHFSTCVEQTIDDILQISDPPLMTVAVVDFLVIAQDDLGHETLEKGLDVIAYCLSWINEHERSLPEKELQRIGKLAGDSLKPGSTGIKRRVMTVCLEMRAIVGDDDRYWAFLGAPEKGFKALMEYYGSKKAAVC